MAGRSWLQYAMFQLRLIVGWGGQGRGRQVQGLKTLVGFLG